MLVIAILFILSGIKRVSLYLYPFLLLLPLLKRSEHIFSLAFKTGNKRPSICGHCLLKRKALETQLSLLGLLFLF